MTYLQSLKKFSNSDTLIYITENLLAHVSPFENVQFTSFLLQYVNKWLPNFNTVDNIAIAHKVTRKVRKKQQTTEHFPIFDSKPIAHFPIFDNKPIADFPIFDNKPIAHYPFIVCQ